jgi:sucrose-6-phosphate hydrolase SacC (GH32 family)
MKNLEQEKQQKKQLYIKSAISKEEAFEFGIKFEQEYGDRVTSLDESAELEAEQIKLLNKTDKSKDFDDYLKNERKLKELKKNRSKVSKIFFKEKVVHYSAIQTKMDFNE